MWPLLLREVIIQIVLKTDYSTKELEYFLWMDDNAKRSRLVFFYLVFDWVSGPLSWAEMGMGRQGCTARLAAG